LHLHLSAHAVAKTLLSAALTATVAGCGGSTPGGNSDPSAGGIGGSSAAHAAGGPSAGQGQQPGAGGADTGKEPATAGTTGLGGGGNASVGGTGGASGSELTAGAGPSAGGISTGGAAQGGSGGQAGGLPTPCGPANSDKRVIAFGTTLDPQGQVCESKALAQSLANPSGSQWRAKGDQKRSYRFKAANADVAYRVVVPMSWDGKAKLPLVMFLHGAGNDESSYLDQNNKQMVSLAQQHGYVLVSPLGYQGAYGTFLRLPAVFGQPAEASKKISAITPESETTNELSEKDVINVIELVLDEYPIDRTAMFLTGHSMGSGGTWYIGAKYADYWAALAPMSGPFVQETGYLWDNVRRMPIFVTEGTQAESLAGSRVLKEWMTSNAFKLQYKEVNADHPGMVPLVLPDVFGFFDGVRTP
jgi:poly(3-hydroxybutyrate) depolymerase